MLHLLRVDLRIDLRLHLQNSSEDPAFFATAAADGIHVCVSGYLCYDGHACGISFRWNFRIFFCLLMLVRCTFLHSGSFTVPTLHDCRSWYCLSRDFLSCRLRNV